MFELVIFVHHLQDGQGGDPLHIKAPHAAGHLLDAAVALGRETLETRRVVCLKLIGQPEHTDVDTLHLFFFLCHGSHRLLSAQLRMKLLLRRLQDTRKCGVHFLVGQGLFV